MSHEMERKNSQTGKKSGIFADLHTYTHLTETNSLFT